MSTVPDLVTRARERFAVRDYHGATLLLQEAVGEGFVYADAFNLLGLSLALIGRQSEAPIAFDRALELNPRYVEAHLNRAILLNDMGRGEEAAAAFQSAEQLGRPDESGYPAMVANRQGAIVNIGGLTGHTGAYNRAHVSTAKAGLVGLTKALAVEFADKGVTVNCVVPGKIGGKRAASAGQGASIPGPGEPLVGRHGTAEEVAGMVVALCLPTGRFITGQTIHISGGLYLP